MKRAGVSVTAFLLVGLSALPCRAVTVPGWDPSYVPQTDMVTFNWEVLAITTDGAVTVPDLPTGNNVDPFIRVFSNGNLGGMLITPVKFQDDKQPNAGNPLGKFNEGQQAGLWYGLEWSGDPQDPHGAPTGATVTRVLRASEILTAIQNIDAGSITPVFALDQNQDGSSPGPTPVGWTGPMAARDIWLRAQLMLIPPAMVDSLLTGGEGGIGMTVTDATNTVLGGSGVVVYTLADDLFNDYPDEVTDPETGNWSHLPRIYNPVDLSTGPPPDPILDGDGNPISIDNNGNGSRGDWGGFFPTLDLTSYDDWGFLIQLQTYFDTDGQEEIYIVGGWAPTPPYIIPEPVTAVALLGGLGALGCYLRRRF